MREGLEVRARMWGGWVEAVGRGKAERFWVWVCRYEVELNKSICLVLSLWHDSWYLLFAWA